MALPMVYNKNEENSAHYSQDNYQQKLANKVSSWENMYISQMYVHNLEKNRKNSFCIGVKDFANL